MGDTVRVGICHHSLLACEVRVHFGLSGCWWWRPNGYMMVDWIQRIYDGG
jgi:hypothetical protein